jgi:hypothetical protein
VGRKRGRGVRWSKVAPKLGFQAHPEFSCRLLRSILPELRGRFIVRKARHVFVVIDGQILDRFEVNPNCRVQMVYSCAA